ncbi:MAG: NAD(P)/FAD-dependent oxidoreductase [Agriterribacter sp.]
MQQTNTLIIGASIAGLSCAACLHKQNLEYIIIEQHDKVATPWRNHYHRLHLHTNKRLSNLPYKKFGSQIPRYPTRQQVVDYLDEYSNAFNINPVFNCQAISVTRDGDYWITTTNKGIFRSANLVFATGIYGKPNTINIKGMETFPGRILHSSDYKTGKDFANKNVLVIGFGNSACEIAIDLYEQGAMPAMSVRSSVNIIPRDILGIPVLELSLLMNNLPPRVADKLNAPLINLLVGNISRLGLHPKTIGPLEQISVEETTPVLDIGTVKHIRKGHIKIYNDIDHINGNLVHFKDGRQQAFDTIVAGIGYTHRIDGIINLDKSRLDDIQRNTKQQQYFGKDGLYFCGFHISATGQIREISLDAKRIAAHIANRKKV